jgi:hypothetical protein
VGGNEHRGSHTITALLNRWQAGDQEALNKLSDLIYGELHRIAAREMRRERGEHTLQTTAVVHESYLRLVRSEPVEWKDRAHFYAVAAQQFRRILVDHARRRSSEKRGGGVHKLSLQECDGAPLHLMSACLRSTRHWLDWNPWIAARRRSSSFGSLADLVRLKRPWSFKSRLPRSRGIGISPRHGLRPNSLE